MKWKTTLEKLEKNYGSLTSFKLYVGSAPLPGPLPSPSHKSKLTAAPTVLVIWIKIFEDSGCIDALNEVSEVL